MAYELGGDSDARFQRMIDRIKKDKEIVCPFCGFHHEDDFEWMDGLITYHAEDGPQERECSECEKTFFVEEHVSRTWTVGKEKDKNGDVIEHEQS